MPHAHKLLETVDLRGPVLVTSPSQSSTNEPGKTADYGVLWRVQNSKHEIHDNLVVQLQSKMVAIVNKNIVSTALHAVSCRVLSGQESTH